MCRVLPPSGKVVVGRVVLLLRAGRSCGVVMSTGWRIWEARARRRFVRASARARLNPSNGSRRPLSQRRTRSWAAHHPSF